MSRNVLNVTMPRAKSTFVKRYGSLRNDYYSRLDQS
jgi:hypothetical protein